MSGAGKRIRMSRLLPGGRTVIVPFDDALINGPDGGLVDSTARIREAAAGGADAVLGFRTLHERSVSVGAVVPFVANLTASTVLARHTRKVLVGSVEAALRAGCDGVAVHVNVTDRHEHRMLRLLGAVSERCQRREMPLLAIMYPCRAGADGSDVNHLDLRETDRFGYVRLVRHCVRIAVELGADIVKTQYTGDPESVARVTGAALGVIAGGRGAAHKHAGFADAIRRAQRRRPGIAPGSGQLGAECGHCRRDLVRFETGRRGLPTVGWGCLNCKSTRNRGRKSDGLTPASTQRAVTDAGDHRVTGVSGRRHPLYWRIRRRKLRSLRTSTGRTGSGLKCMTLLRTCRRWSSRLMNVLRSRGHSSSFQQSGLSSTA